MPNIEEIIAAVSDEDVQDARASVSAMANEIGSARLRMIAYDDLASSDDI
ncbi:hypothetical protein [Sorangium sp. So ce426]